jgi:hypothetical protein
VLGTWLDKLKGKDKFETMENYSILSILIGSAILSIGLALTIFTPKGLPAILAMLGSLIAFISTVILILIWLAREILGG